MKLKCNRLFIVLIGVIFVGCSNPTTDQTIIQASDILKKASHYYAFKSGSGTIATDSLGLSNGTITGAIWNSGGIQGNCLSFNTDRNSDNVSTGVNLSTTIFTINLWAKQTVSTKISLAGTMTNPSGGKTGFLFHSGGFGGAASGCAAIVSWQSNNVWINLFGTTSVTTSTWNMYTFIYVAGGTSKIYQNSVLTATLPNSPSNPSNSSTLQIGRSFTTITDVNQVWGGLIDELGIWDRELTQEEITAIYNSGSGCTYP
jgi:hypothetical protein